MKKTKEIKREIEGQDPLEMHYKELYEYYEEVSKQRRESENHIGI